MPIFLAMMLFAVLTLSAAPASAGKLHVFDSSFGEKGSGAGQFKEPSGVAVNEVALGVVGDVYVVDKGNNRVEHFSAEGKTLKGEFNGSGLLAGEGKAAGSGGLPGEIPTGTFSSPSAIAVDNSTNPLDESAGDVYVADFAHNVVDKFTPEGGYLGQITTGAGASPLGEIFGVAVDSAGVVWVYQASKEIDNYSDALPNVLLSSRNSPFETSPGFAVDSEDDLYVNRASTEVAKLNSSGEELIHALDGETTTAAAVDLSNNNVYIDNVSSVAVFNAALGCTVSTPCEVAPAEVAPLGAFVERFGSEHLTEGSGIAINSGSPSKLVYVADHAADAVRVFQEVIRPTVTTAPPSEVRATSVTLNGTVNPEGLPVTSCSFEYGTSASYGHVALCEPSPGSGNTQVPVSAKLAALQPDTIYHYRLAASNENGTTDGGVESFTTPGPGLHGEGVTEVTADSVTFDASINPHGAPTFYYFQYGTSSAYETSVPAQPGLSLGSGEGDVQAVPQHVQGLSPGTVYHYRVVAVQAGQEYPGPDQTFTTQTFGGGLVLPDGRAWELVSPVDKGGAVITGIGPLGVIQAAPDGGAISYVANGATEAAPPGNDASEVQVLSTRGAAGWTSRDISSPHETVAGSGTERAIEFAFLSQNLSSALIQPHGRFNPGLSPEASEQTPYLRALGSCAISCFHPIVSGKAGYANVPAGTSFGEEQVCEEERGIIGLSVETLCGPRFRGATPDLTHVVFSSKAPLVAGAGPNQLYGWSHNSISLLSVLPPNAQEEELPAPSGPEELDGPLLGARSGEAHGSARRAISIDGSRVFWETHQPGALYMRDLATDKTLQIDAAEPACLEEEETKCSSGLGQFQIASVDGSVVYFTDEARLTKDATAAPQKPDLYECAIAVTAGQPHCNLSDLTSSGSNESVNVLGNVVGASEDGRAVYFVANGPLSGVTGAVHGTCRAEGPPDASCNLYLRREGTPTQLVAVLSGEDENEWTTGQLEAQMSSVSPNGEWLAFLSATSVTGYDNRDVSSSRPDAEAYLYNASTSDTVCVSCNPTGARPRGVEYQQLESGNSKLLLADRAEWSPSGWVSALLPRSTAFAPSASAYQARYLSDSGRLFFNSADALVSQDVNETGDVYEYEPARVGNCTDTSPTFAPRAVGCIGLISSGTSARASGFLDASQSGSDAFFITAAKLTSQDTDTRNDVYDAHECSAASPCFAAEASEPQPCTTEASCRPSPSLQPEIFGAPPSATFNGPGNLTPPTPVPVKPKTAAQVRAQQLAKAVKACRTKHNKHKRKACEAQARKRYGPTKAKMASHTTTTHKRG